jgi:pyrimidine-specific ribonucleoside hydrolase
MRPRPIPAVALALLAVAAACTPTAAPSEGQSASPGDTPASATVRPLLVDTDVAADDLVAISVLLGSPEVDIKAITVSGTGEAHCDSGVDVVLRLLERLQAPPIPVACGRETPIAGDHTFPAEWRTAVDAGSGLNLPTTALQPASGTAVGLITATASETPGLHVLTLGPLTNLAEAIGADPTLAEGLASVTIMGGAVRVPGNLGFGGPADNDVAEWNIYVDPTAAQTVIDSGVAVRLVSLDGTNNVPVTPAFAKRVRDEATGAGGQVLAELFAANPWMAEGGYYLWDPLAAAIAAGHPLGSFEPARIDIEEAEGPEVGFTRPVEGTPNVEYLSGVEKAAAEDILVGALD